MRRSALLALVGLALVAATGARGELRSAGDLLAQESPRSSGSDMQDRPGTPPATNRSAPPSSAGTGTDAATAALMKEKDVVDSSGDKIGKVKDVQGRDAIVSVGGFLGLGEREVRVPRDRLTIIGSGDDAKVQTTLTKDELKALHEGVSGNGSDPPRRTAPNR